MTMSAVEARARSLFSRCVNAECNTEPQVIARATGRVNLIGDHVDYAGGLVLPMALCEQTVVAASRASHEQFYTEALHSDGCSDHSKESRAQASVDPSWLRYAHGVLHELRAEGVEVPPALYAIASDVAIGAGLASSAALEIAIARAALALTGATIAPRALALLCQRAEHRHAGVPCGIMDQWSIAHANAEEAIALDCASLESRVITLPPSLRITILDSGERHTLRDGAFEARRSEVESAARALGVVHLAHLPENRWDEIDALPSPLNRRARHVVRETQRVRDAVIALDANDLERFGALMHASHASLRDDFEVSTPCVDALVEQALRDGALGARITGAGFGGCIVAAWRA